MDQKQDTKTPSVELLISRLDRAEFVLQKILLTREDRARIEARRDKLIAAIAEIENEG